MAHRIELADKRRRAFAAIPDAHERAPSHGEVYEGPEGARLRLQDYAFCEGFVIVGTKRETKKRGLYTFECHRHGKKPQNKHKLTDETRQRHQTNTQWFECPYKVQLYLSKPTSLWNLRVNQSSHNHPMMADPFVHQMHYARDPDRLDALESAQSMRSAGQPYTEANRVLRQQGLRFDRKAYYNTERTGTKRTNQEEVELALAILGNKGYHIKKTEKWVVEQDERQHKIIEHFFFTSQRQIVLARQFVSNFVLITDATFNTNENKLVLVAVTNTQKSLPVAYCYIRSETTEAFVFMMECMRDFFFYDRWQSQK